MADGKSFVFAILLFLICVPVAFSAPSVSSISPTSGPIGGGTNVTITGSGFSGGSDSYTKLLIHADGTGASFVDSSPSPKTITPTGNATQSSAQSKFGGKSAYLSGNVLSIPDSEDWNFGSGDFTIDAWIKTGTAYTNILGQGYYNSGSDYQFGVVLTQWPGGYFRMLGSSAPNSIAIDITHPTVISNNAWHHVAVIRSGNTVYLAVDGVLTNGTTFTSSFLNANAPYQIGWSDYNGYIDEVRVSKGIARWTSNFTPPANPYGLINVSMGGTAATNLLLVNATTINATTPAHTAGIVDVVVSAPDGQSTLSNGFTFSGPQAPGISFIPPTPQDGLSTPNTSVQINVSIIEQNLSALKFNWNGTNYSYYDDSLVLSMNLDNNSALGENATKAVDNSKYGNNGTIAGASWNASGKNNGALNFNGAGNYVNLGSSALNIVGPITVELWINPVNRSQYQTIYGRFSGVDTNQHHYLLFIEPNGTIAYFNLIDGLYREGAAVTYGQWQHIAFTYNGSGVIVYKNGVAGQYRAVAAPASQPAYYSYLGASWEASLYWYQGQMDEVRIWSRSLSAAEIAQHYQSNLKKFNSSQWHFQSNQSNLSTNAYSYSAWANNTAGSSNQTETRLVTTGFVPPPLPQVSSISPTSGPIAGGTNITINGTNFASDIDANTKLLLHADGTGASFVDSSPISKTITAYGDATQSNLQSKFGGKSAYFDGNGDYLTIPASSDFVFTDNFTVDMWIYPTGSIVGASTPFSFGSHGGSYNDSSVNILPDNTLWMYKYNAGVGYDFSVSTTAKVINNTWNHIAMVRSGSTVTLYLNGLNVATASYSGTFNSNLICYIGYRGDGYAFNGYIDEFRVSKSIARWTSNFASPTKEYGQMNVTLGGTQATNITLVNSTTINATTPAHTVGIVDVVVSTPDGQATLSNGFTFGQVGDTTSPEVVLSSPASGNKTTSASATFTCNALDNIALSNVTLFIWNASGSQIYSNATQLSGTSNSTSWAYTFANRGAYSWNCLAYDNSNNSAYATSNATLIIQKYARLDTIYPAGGAGISRGKNGAEDVLALVPDNMTIIARVTDNESGQGVSGAQCGLFIDGSAKWSSTSNSSGYCIFAYNKSADSFGTRQLSINQSNLPSEYAPLSDWSNTTFKLENWSLYIEVDNYRTSVGTFYYAGDLALVNISVRKDGAPVDIVNISLIMTDQIDQALSQANSFIRLSTGVYQAELMVPSGTVWLRWKATASSDFSGQDSTATSGLHTDMAARSAPVAQLNFTMTNSSGQPLANSEVIIYRKGALGRYAVLNQTMNSGTLSLQQPLIQNDSNYDLEIKTPEGSAISIQSFNLSAGLNFATQQANFSGAKPNQTRYVSPVLASNATSFSTSTLTFVKSFEPNSICLCQNWSFASSSCPDAWVCNSTSAYSYSSNSTHFWFNVTHFTGYALGQSENENLTIWDETDSGMQYGNQIKYIGQNTRFFANYSNSSSQPITGADCQIWFLDSGWNAMGYNSTNLYEYTRVFTSGGTFDWNVTCNKSGQATLTTNDTVLVNSTIAVVLNSPADSAIVKSAVITFNWTPYGFPGDPTCNLTRNGSVVYSATCTNNALCGYTNTTANGEYIWNVTCNSGATTRESSTRTLTVNTLYHSTNVEGVLNMNITEITSISLPQSTISFGTVEITQTYDSYPSQFFVIKNDGNTIVDIEVNATNPFLSSNCTSLPCSAYQVKVGANETIPYPSCSGNPTKETYTNMYGSSSGLLINDFNFVDNDDSANVYIKFRLPNDEPPGSKSSTVTFWAKSAGSYACN